MCLWSLFVCLACSNRRSDLEVDRLNSISYDFHYRNIDSTEAYARKALAMAAGYSSGAAEALNNLAFVNIAKMNYCDASRQLDSVYSITGNQIELLIADVQHMRLCQRQAVNKSFYDYKEKARKRMLRIDEESDELSPRLQRRLTYAKTEYSFVASTYYYYVGLYEQSRNAIRGVDQQGLMQKDTAQYLNWLYQTGSGGMIKDGDKERILQKEYDRLLECYLMAKRHGFMYWEANAIQALSEHLFDKNDREILVRNNRVSMGYVNPDNMPDTLLAGYLAQKSFDMFVAYGDTYQTAGSLRTLAKCYWGIGDYRSALHWLDYSLGLGNGKIRQAPDLVASIREQLSIVYSSLNDKHDSDINRNIYLDMQEKTRQDMELDARATQLDETSRALNMMIFGIIALSLLLFVLIVLLLRNNKVRSLNIDRIHKAMDEFKKCCDLKEKNLRSSIDEREEQIELLRFDTDGNKRRNIENRARVFLVESVKPLIDRIENEIGRLINRIETRQDKLARYEYIKELTDTIDRYNDVLTNWIQLRQGKVGLHVESFPLSDVFDVVRHGATVFSIQGVKLSVKPTDAVVKADRVLTLFMINTIADNARKNTPHGGTVEISAKDNDGEVEISVTDTGKGMSEDECKSIFSRTINKGHGFGLLNCRGILNSYKKYSSLFSMCRLSVESSVGKGCRFSFTLPKGSVRALVIMAMLFPTGASIVSKGNVKFNKQSAAYMDKASVYADSAYHSNINGDYASTLSYADSVVCNMNCCYLSCYPGGKCLMRQDGEPDDAAEIQWFRYGLDYDYSVILSMRNECAVAALALHRWDLYNYNNSVYTKLFKEVSADGSLGEYCRIMQKSEANKNIAVTILVILLVVLLATSYVVYYRKTVRRHSIEDLCKDIVKLLLDDMPVENKVSRMSAILKNPYSNEIADVVESVSAVLHSSKISKDKLLHEIVTFDEMIRKQKFERDRLYVSNNILENCLSAIKHETMYYPARIKQYIQEQESCGDMSVEKLGALRDIVGYYRDLYFTLCAQIHKQVENSVVACSKVDLSAMVNVESTIAFADNFLLLMLFEILRRQNARQTPDYSVERSDGGYVVLKADMLNVPFSGSNPNVLFTPRNENLPYMVCRQIIREIENATNRCGCGITASSYDGHLVLKIVLPR